MHSVAHHDPETKYMNVQIFIPCFVDQLYPQTGFNMVKVLKKAGCTVNYIKEQTCCGQPAYNAGFRDEARAVCAKFLKDFEGQQYIVTPSASCAGFIRNYYTEVFSNSSQLKAAKEMKSHVFELTDFLVNILKVEDLGARFDGKATYHDSCAGLREYGIKEAPRKLLSNVKGLEITEMNDVETCCGFGGTFSVKFETISYAMGEQKALNTNATGAGFLISTDLSCLMHIDGVLKKKSLPVRTMHIADVLASGY